MADAASKYIVRTNIHRKKMIDKCVANVGNITPFTKMFFGTGGKTATGELKVPNGATPQLFAKVIELPISGFTKITDFEYVAKCTIDTSAYPSLVGKDINERAIVDSDGVVAVIETFAGFGLLQANKSYEHAIRFTMV